MATPKSVWDRHSSPTANECFLACKTTLRDAAGSATELEQSLKMLQTDHVDLYQLHALTKMEDVEKVFGPGGAMETFQKAKKDGKVRYIGFSAHSEESAHAALDRFDFDSILFPLGFPLWIKNGFGPSVHKRARETGKGILAFKAMAHQQRTGRQPLEEGVVSNRLTRSTRLLWPCDSRCIYP